MKISIERSRAIRGAAAAALQAAIAAGAAASAQAQIVEAAGGRLELTTLVEKAVQVPQADGAAKTELVAVDVTSAGDEVVYTVTFTNVDAGAVDHVRITSPIPDEMRYVANTAYAPGSAVLYSVDGGLTFGTPKELVIEAADGTRRVADAADYTHVRWILEAPLDPGAKGFARFRAVVR